MATPRCWAITRCSPRAGTGEVLFARMRKGSTHTARGAGRFVDELVAVVKRAGATGALTMRADSGFWSWGLIDRLDRHGIGWSITVRQIPAIKTAIASIDEDTWVGIGYTVSGQAQVAETTYCVGKGRKARRVRLVVRRTRLTDRTQRQLWPHWRHHACITNVALGTVAADAFHRRHATVEFAIRDLKEGSGLAHLPSGHYSANCAWLACAVLAHNLGHWTGLLTGAPPITNRTRRTQLIALAAVFVNRSGKPTLRFPARWPWAHQFQHTLRALRALPEPSG